MKMPLYRHLASLLLAVRTCEKSGNVEWQRRHAETIDELCREHLPHGSGIDGPHATLRISESSPDRLVIGPADFHHMDEFGGYDGWTYHTLIVKPSLAFDIELRVTGGDRNNIKYYLGDVFRDALTAEIER